MESIFLSFLLITAFACYAQQCKVKYVSSVCQKNLITESTSGNFMLNQAVKLLETKMKALNARFVFEYNSADHFTVDGNAFVA
ncbi:hypothetical protein [Mucilaginibacter gynuensis]|uniref:hypothetical protein n=1 Tax=Mucilaginibacter gynuensis TaxID=1302236 RepID=UPI0031F1B0C0